MIDVRRSPELQAAILASKGAPAELRRDIYKQARQELGGQWVPALQRRAATRLEQRILVKGARVRVSNEGFTMLAATSTKALSGGLVPVWDYAGPEFGAHSRKLTYKRRSPKGTIHQVTRTINRQFRSRQKTGRVAFDAASELGTKLVASWVRTIVRVYRNAVGDDRG